MENKEYIGTVLINRSLIGVLKTILVSEFADRLEVEVKPDEHNTYDSECFVEIYSDKPDTELQLFAHGFARGARIGALSC